MKLPYISLGQCHALPMNPLFPNLPSSPFPLYFSLESDNSLLRDCNWNGVDTRGSVFGRTYPPSLHLSLLLFSPSMSHLETSWA